MNQRTSIQRRHLRGYIAAVISYVLLFGQLVPLTVAAAPKRPAPSAVPTSAPAPAEPLRAAPLAAPAPVFAPSITATKVDAFDDTVIPNGKAEPGQVITYTVTITNSGPDPATGVTFTDSVDSNTTLVAGSVKAQPIASPDTATAFGNVRISTANGAPNLLANDCDPNPNNTPCTNAGLTASGPTTSTQGGNVTINSDGTFSYNPAPGFTGTDTFTYTVTDGDSQTDTATMTITVGPTLVWFIDNSAGTNGDGRLGSPFNSIAAFNAGAADEAGDIIFLYTGTGTYSGGLILLNTQKLIGQGFALATETGTPPTGSDALPSAGSAPTIDNANANIITLGQNNTLRGFNTGNSGSSGNDIAGTSFGTLTISALSVNGDGRALNLATGTLAATVGNISASNTGTNAGLTLNAVGGSLTVSGSTTITNSGGTGIDVTNAPASTSYSFGSTTVNKNSTSGIGVNLATNNASVTTSFSSLTVTTTNGFAIQTNGGGTVNVTTGSLTQSGAGGGAASLTNTALGLTFTSVSSNGGANGLIISGGTGSFTSGTTNLQNNAGLGLLMSSSAVVANFGNTTVNSSAGDAVDLASNSGNITFADLDMTPDAGLRGLDAQNNTGTITVTSGDITTSGGATAAAVFIDGPVGRTPINLTFTSVTTSGVGSTTAGSIHLVDASGTKFQVTGTTQVNTRAGHGIFVDNSTMTTLQFATVNVPNPSAAGGDGIHIEDTSSATTITTTTISDANRTVAQNDGDVNFVPDNDGDGNAIFLRGNSGSFTLSGGTLSNCGNDCIDVRDSQSLALSGITISSPGVDEVAGSTTGNGGHGIQAYNLTGTNTITNTTITDWEQTARHGLIWNNHSSTASTLTIHGSTFSNSANGAAAILATARDNANMTLNVGGTGGGQPCSFLELDAYAIISNAGDNTNSTATLNTNIRNNSFINNYAVPVERGNNGIVARNANAGKTIVVINGNTFDGGGRTIADTAGVIDIGGDALLNGNFIHFTITNNTIRNVGDATDGSCGAGVDCDGKRAIDVFIDDATVIGNDTNAALDADDTVLIDGNVITNVHRAGIQFDIGQTFNGSDIAAKITNNRVGIHADNTIDRVGKGDALSAGGEWAILIENRTQNVKNLNILVSNNLFYNGNGGTGSTLNNSGMLIRTQRSGTMSGTVTNNTFNVSTSGSSFGINAGTVNTGTPVLCLDASGNTITAPGGGINLAESVGTLNVEQASSAALSTANGGATVNIATGTPSFGVACAAPPAAPETFDSGLGQGLGATADASSASPASRTGQLETPPAATSAQPIAARPRAKSAPRTLAPASKREGGSTFRYAAADTSAPLNPVPAPAPEPIAQRRKKVLAPVLSDDPGGPNGAGGTVSINIGTLAPSDSVTITFQVTIDNPYSGGPNVSNQGTVSGSNFSNVLTDDPAVGGAADPTLTPINATDIRINDAQAPEPATGNSSMLFTLTLSQPAPTGGLTVTYNTADSTATGGSSCGGTVDYVTAAGATATVPAGSRIATIPITVCADSDSPESNETFTVNISSPTAGTIVDGSATGTITQGTTSGTFLISELRTSGPGGVGDDFLELYNNTGSPLTVAASDSSAGYGIFKMGASCAETPVLIGTIPNGTVIPARGHYLLVGSAYSLANYGGTGAAAGNLTMASDIENDRNVAVFTTDNVANLSSANLLDAVGFGTNTGAVCDLMREGNNLGATSGSTTEYSFFRKLCPLGTGTGCPVSGNPKDSNDGASDFTFVDTNGTFISGIPQKLGAPGPENLASPIRRDTSGIGLPLLDGSVASASVPNRARSFTSDPANNSTYGTLTIRRRVVNNTGGSVTRLRFRVVEMTTFPSASNVADLRARTGVTEASVGPVGDATTCTASGAGSPPCNVAVQATTLEMPPNQPNGGGINSTLSAGTITTGTPLANGASLNVNFLLGIQQTGTFRFLIIIEALP